MPHAPTQHIDGKVISILDGVHEAGQFQTVTLNKGSADGLDKGTVLSIYKRDRQVKVDLEDGKKGRKSVVKYVSIPAEETALAMVYRTGEHLSSAIILENLTNVNIGDTVSNPAATWTTCLTTNRTSATSRKIPTIRNTTNTISTATSINIDRLPATKRRLKFSDDVFSYSQLKTK